MKMELGKFIEVCHFSPSKPTYLDRKNATQRTADKIRDADRIREEFENLGSEIRSFADVEVERVKCGAGRMMETLNGAQHEIERLSANDLLHVLESPRVVDDAAFASLCHVNEWHIPFSLECLEDHVLPQPLICLLPQCPYHSVSTPLPYDHSMYRADSPKSL